MAPSNDSTAEQEEFTWDTFKHVFDDHVTSDGDVNMYGFLFRAVDRESSNDKCLDRFVEKVNHTEDTTHGMLLLMDQNLSSMEVGKREASGKENIVSILANNNEVKKLATRILRLMLEYSDG